MCRYTYILFNLKRNENAIDTFRAVFVCVPATGNCEYRKYETEILPNRYNLIWFHRSVFYPFFVCDIKKTCSVYQNWIGNNFNAIIFAHSLNGNENFIIVSFIANVFRKMIGKVKFQYINITASNIYLNMATRIKLCPPPSPSKVSFISAKLEEKSGNINMYISE